MQSKADQMVAEVTNARTAVLAFCASWCPQCNVQQRAFEQASAVLGDCVRTCWVDVDLYPALVERFAIEAIPTILILRYGLECLRLTGLQPEDALVSHVRALALQAIPGTMPRLRAG